MQIVRRVREALSYIDELEPSSRVIVRSSYNAALTMAFYFTVVFGALSLLSSLFIKEKPIGHKKP